MSEAALAEDEQLALYVEILRQNGAIIPGQKVYVGQIYLTDDVARENGVQSVWTLPSPHALPRLVNQLAYMDRHIKTGDFIPIRGIATGTRAPCQSCGLVYMCPASLAKEAVQPTEEEDV